MFEVQNETTDQDPVFQVLHAHQTLPPESWEAFEQAYKVLAVNFSAAIPTAVHERPDPGKVAYLETSKTFPSFTL